MTSQFAESLSNREQEEFIKKILMAAEVQVTCHQQNIMVKLLAEREKARQAKNN